MTQRRNRREFLQTSGALGAGFFINASVPAIARRSPNEQISLAGVGCGGRGGGDIDESTGAGGVFAALCDVDRKSLEEKAKKHPKAKLYQDYRKMFDEMAKEIDAVTVGVADHAHAAIALTAMRLGKHCYTEKPLTHDIWEAREMAKVAREKKLATQMGNQGTSGKGLRRTVECIQAGTIGDAKEVHIWTNRPVWPQSPNIKARPKDEPVPEHINWDVWLGPAPERPYSSKYHPFKWRGWWDFGTGALGDMACHTANVVYMALKLTAPTHIEAESEEPNPETYPAWAHVTYKFPRPGGGEPIMVHWYEGKKPSGERVLPNKELYQGEKISDSGSMIIGAKGTMYSPNDYGESVTWLPKKDFEGFKEPAPTLPRSPGHHPEWHAAIKGTGKSMSNFPDYAGPLTEFVLLGNVAIKLGKKLEWSAEKLEVTNCPDAAKLIKRDYRPGFGV